MRVCVDRETNIIFENQKETDQTLYENHAKVALL